MIKYVIKKNGEVAEFDKLKIHNSIMRAMELSGETVREDVARFISDWANGYFHETPTTYQVEDFVYEQLIRLEQSSPAKVYVEHKANQLLKIKKKDNTIENFDANKIRIAINKSANRVSIKLSEEDELRVIVDVIRQCKTKPINIVTVGELHNLVEVALLKTNKEVAESYRSYRNYKVDFVGMLDQVYSKAQSILYIGDKENSNADSSLVSTKRSLIAGELSKELYQRFFLTKEEVEACKTGFIYVHDMRDRMYTLNCCLADVSAIMRGGFEMGNIWYNEPKTLDVACDVLGDIIMSMASQQYGE